MAAKEQGADWNAQARQRGLRTMLRLAAWGSLATVALFIAVMTAYSSTGRANVDQDMARPRSASGEGATRDIESAEVRRLTDVVRVLAADRDQALARIATLERNLDNITGSIRRTSAAANTQPAALPTAPPAVTPTPSPPPEAPTQASAPPPARPETPPFQIAISPAPQPPLPQPAPQPPSAQQPTSAVDAPREPTPDRVAALPSIPQRSANPASPVEAPTAGLGLDVGGAINYEGLRTLWHSIKSSEASLTDELYPVVAVRENNKTHGIDLRLVIGPIDDTETASRLCAALTAAHHYCQPVAFEGQRLTVNEPPPVKPVPVHRSAPPKQADPSKPDANAKPDSPPWNPFRPRQQSSSAL